MLISQLYKDCVLRLKEVGIDEPELESSLLLSHILHRSRTNIYLSGNEAVSKDCQDRFKSALAKRLERTPFAYITGEQEFWSMPFAVTPDVLIPRPETEQIIELVLAAVDNSSGGQKNILDLGTGSGVLAVILAKEMKNALVVAVDRSFAALKVARANSVRHGLSERVLCVCSDWGNSIQNKKWDVIVSNPPYIASDALKKLAPEVRKEPESALDGGSRGMVAIAVLALQLQELLKPGGWFFMEIGFDQQEFVLELFHAITGLENVAVHLDLAGLPRVLQAQKREEING